MASACPTRLGRNLRFESNRRSRSSGLFPLERKRARAGRVQGQQAQPPPDLPTYPLSTAGFGFRSETRFIGAAPSLSNNFFEFLFWLLTYFFRKSRAKSAEANATPQASPCSLWLLHRRPAWVGTFGLNSIQDHAAVGCFLWKGNGLVREGFKDSKRSLRHCQIVFGFFLWLLSYFF